MSGSDYENGEPKNTGFTNSDGWGASSVTGYGSGSTPAFQTVATFVDWWTHRQGSEPIARAITPVECTSVADCQSKLATLRIGDVILYDYSDITSDSANYEWNHATIVVGKSDFLDVASRGALVKNSGDSTTYDCRSGWPLRGYLNPLMLGDRTFDNGLLVKVGGLHINYEEYQP